MSAMVLVVDDDPVQRRLLSEMVRRAGYAVEALEGGAAALDRLADRTHKSARMLLRIFRVIRYVGLTPSMPRLPEARVPPVSRGLSEA